MDLQSTADQYLTLKSWITRNMTNKQNNKKLESCCDAKKKYGRDAGTLEAHAITITDRLQR
jgi:hypothetical protein